MHDGEEYQAGMPGAALPPTGAWAPTQGVGGGREGRAGSLADQEEPPPHLPACLE